MLDTMSTGADLPRVGDVLAGKYELARTLGEGGMAVVFEGRHRRSGQRVAVKVLAPEFARNPEIVARFDREARAVGRLRTRHVAHVLEVATTSDGLPFLVMEFLDGRDLAAELAARRTLPLGEAVDYVLQTCAAMHEAHRAGIIHRDLKPANLFLVNEGPYRVVKVLDFGLSKMEDASKLTGADAVMGTVLYMSPEQLRASTDVDRRGDIWSIGVVLFELLAGRAPFEGAAHEVALAIVGQDAPDLRTYADVPAPVADAVARMLKRDREAHFSDARDVAIALAPFAAPGTLGASAAALLAEHGELPAPHSTAGKTLLLMNVKKTMPLASAPRASRAPAPPAEPTPRRAPEANAHASQGSGTRPNVPLLAGAGLAILALVGGVLVVLSLVSKREASTSSVTTSSATAIESSPEPSATTDATNAPASAAPSTNDDAPPAAESASSATAPSSPASTTRPTAAPAARPRRDGGAAPKPTTTPTADPTTNPTLL